MTRTPSSVFVLFRMKKKKIDQCILFIYRNSMTLPLMSDRMIEFKRGTIRYNNLSKDKRY